MAVYSNLPVYEECYRLFVQTVQVTAKIQRDYRYSLGDEVKRKLMDVMMLVYKANRVEARTPLIAEAHDRLVEAQLLFRVLNEVRQVSDGQFALLMEHTVNVGRQLTAWERYSTKKIKEENSEKV